MRNKYGAKKAVSGGRSFASQGERNLYHYLMAKEQAGEIKVIQTQASVYLTDAKILYKPDFKVLNLETGQEEWIEFKGFETPEWRIKRRLWQHYGPGILRVYKGYGKALKEFEVIEGPDEDSWEHA